MGNSLKSANDRLRQAHGSTGAFANYAWKLAGECEFPLWNGQFDYRAQDSGLIVPYPVYERRNMCRNLDPKQWVLCRYLAPPTEAEWQATVGLNVEYPPHGYYAPTNVELDLGINPWDESRGVTITDAVIAFAKQQRDKTRAEIDREGEEILARKDAAQDAALDEQIGDLLLPFANVDHVPGKRGGPVSTPFTKQDAASVQHA
jgi:hypothetical protein